MADITQIKVGSTTYDIKDTSKLPKFTNEWRKEYNAGGTAGYMLIGSFPMYDSNITIDIDSTTATTYHGTVVIATQNVSTTSIGSAHTITVYGDPTGTISNAITVTWVSGSRNYNVYFAPDRWSKNFISARGIGQYMDEINTSTMFTFTTGTAPATTSGLTVVNALTNTFAPKSHNHAATNITSGTLSADRLPTVPVTKGGTGATDAATARTNLGAAASSHPHGNITNDGTITSTAVTSATGVLVYDSNNKIQRATAANLRSIIGAGTSSSDTKNTAGATNSSSKLFLVGATEQAANPQTYTHDTAYVGTDGCLYSNSAKVIVEGDSRLTNARTPSSHPHGNITNGGALGTASRIVITDSSKNITTGSIDPANLVVTTDTRLTNARTPTAHNQASNTINAMTGYSKPLSTSAIATTDTLNAAIGKLEKAIEGKTSNTGTITGVTAGNGLTNGGTSGSVTLHVGAGTGITVNANDVAVKYGTEAGTACQGNDSRLSNARTPTSHAHGNITNSGTITSTAVTSATGVLVYDSSNKIQRATAASTRSIIGAASTSVATTSANGLMSKEDKAKLDSMGSNPGYTYGTEDLVAGTSPLANGLVYFVYE